jgi:hypothetical protein
MEMVGRRHHAHNDGADGCSHAVIIACGHLISGVIHLNNEIGIIDNIPNTRISESAIHGKGLFSMASIPAGAILAVLDGQLVPLAKQYIVSADICASHCEWNAVSKDMLLVRALGSCRKNAH